MNFLVIYHKIIALISYQNINIFADFRAKSKEKLDFWPESMYFLLLIQKFLLLLHQTNNHRYGAEAGHIDRT